MEASIINRMAIKVRLFSLTLRSYLIKVDPQKMSKIVTLQGFNSVNISSWRKHSFMLKLTKQNAWRTLLQGTGAEIGHFVICIRQHQNSN